MRLRKTDLFVVVRADRADAYVRDGIPACPDGAGSAPHRAYDSLDAAEHAADDLDLCSNGAVGHAVVVIDSRRLSPDALGPDDGILEGRALRRRIPAAAVRGLCTVDDPF
jgi:hypothetical protein